MRKVIGIGETVLDIIFRDDSPIAALPGGSTYNAMISLGRSGVDCTFISEVGDDRVGDRIVKFLQENGVDSQCVCRFRGTKSPLSLAFLNDKNDAEYIFYKDHPRDRLDFAYPNV
jgi:fructokinase